MCGKIHVKSTMQNNVSRFETSMLKGVAISMMLWLHLFLKESDMGNYTDLNLANGEPLAYFLTRLCTPVSFFLILSGYGLLTCIITIVYRHELNFPVCLSFTFIIGGFCLFLSQLAPI